MTVVTSSRRYSKWRELVDSVVIPKLADYKRRGIIPTLRTIFYFLYSLKKLPNTPNSYAKIGDYIVEARKDGRISWDAIADETRRSIAGFYDFYVSPESYIRQLFYGDEGLDTLHERYVPEILYKWHKQPYYVEVWLEKTALLGTFRNFLKDKHVRIIPNRGYTSWAFAYENFKRLKDMSEEYYFEWTDKEKTDVQRKVVKKKIKILYFGDYDPSGSDMDRFLKEGIADYFIKYLGLEGIVEFEPRIAVTLDQIERFNLPPNPDKSDTETLEKLERDPRYAKFLKAHEGQLYAVELDALMAYVPDEFERIVKGAVDQYFDQEIWEEVLRQEEHSTEAISASSRRVANEWLNRSDSDPDHGRD
jgi:hypothetical protein